MEVLFLTALMNRLQGQMNAGQCFLYRTFRIISYQIIDQGEAQLKLRLISAAKETTHGQVFEYDLRQLPDCEELITWIFANVKKMPNILPG